jgi:cyclic-di-GMP-binding protein
MALSLTLPRLESHPANPPETRVAHVSRWLADAIKRDPVSAAQVIGDALAATNRVGMSDSRRMELAEAYWSSAGQLWPRLERQVLQASHPLTGAPLEAAKAALTLAQELSTAFKHLLASEAGKRISLGGVRLASALVHRCLQCFARVLAASYQSYSPVPANTWIDAHAVYAYARDRGVHLATIPGDVSEATPERIYVQALLLALANPYGFHPGQLGTVLAYLQTHTHWAKLTDVAPVHRLAKSVAIVPVGHDFPPFSANKGGSIEGSRLYLLTFDLAFQLQEELRALEGGGDMPKDLARDPASRRAYVALLQRLLRQWAIPPARQFNRLPSRARVVMCVGFAGAWQYSKGRPQGVTPPQVPGGLPPMTHCQVINHTPAGYALRQTDTSPASLRIGELVSLRVEGRLTLQLAVVRWFRNTLKGTSLEFGCELLADDAEAAGASHEGAAAQGLMPVIVLPGDDEGPDATPWQVVAPAGAFQLEQAIALHRGTHAGTAVLTKLSDQGPGYDIHEYVSVE